MHRRVEREMKTESKNPKKQAKAEISTIKKTNQEKTQISETNWRMARIFYLLWGRIAILWTKQIVQLRVSDALFLFLNHSVIANPSITFSVHLQRTK